MTTTPDPLAAALEAAARIVKERALCRCSPYKEGKCDDCIVRDALVRESEGAK